MRKTDAKMFYLAWGVKAIVDHEGTVTLISYGKDSHQMITLEKSEAIFLAEEIIRTREAL